MILYNVLMFSASIYYKEACNLLKKYRKPEKLYQNDESNDLIIK